MPWILVFFEGISGTPDSSDEIEAIANIDCSAKTADVDVNGSLIDGHILSPHAVEQLLTREHPTWHLHQKLKQPKLRGTKMNFSPTAHHSTTLAIEF